MLQENLNLKNFTHISNRCMYKFGYFIFGGWRLREWQHSAAKNTIHYNCGLSVCALSEHTDDLRVHY